MTDRVLQASGRHLATQQDKSPDVGIALREASEALRLMDYQWARVTTAMQPSHDYVTAARDLFTILKDIGQLDLKPIISGHSETSFDIEQTLPDLNIGGADLVALLHDTQHLPDVLVRSQLLFAPARTLKPRLDLLASRARGGYVEVPSEDEHQLTAAASAAAIAGRVASETLGFELQSLRCLRPLELHSTTAPGRLEL